MGIADRVEARDGSPWQGPRRRANVGRLPLSVWIVVAVSLLAIGVLLVSLWLQEARWEARVAALQATQTEQIAKLMEREGQTLGKLMEDQRSEMDKTRSAFDRELAARDARVRTLAWEVRQAKALVVAASDSQ